MTKLLFVDVETTGTNVEYGTANKRDNRCLQIAYVLTDEDMNVLASDDIVIKEGGNVLKSMNDYVKDMHTSTGLIDRINSSEAVSNAEATNRLMEKIPQFLDEGERLVAVGNNVQFDVEVIRQNFPELFVKLHYGLLDVSSVRKAIDLAHPGFSKIVTDNKKSNHDALVDIMECMKELKYYTNIFKTALR